MGSTGSTTSRCIRVGNQPHFDQSVISVGSQSGLGNRSCLSNQSDLSNQSQQLNQKPTKSATRASPLYETGLTVELLAVEFSRDVEVRSLQRSIEPVYSVTYNLFAAQHRACL
jgi:hypothetical protein